MLRFPLFVVVMSALFGFATGYSQPVEVDVQVAADRPQWAISRYLTGMHFVYGFERDSLYQDERIAEWMRRAQVGMIRWPGGTAVQSYHWDRLNGISFNADSWDPQYKGESAPPENYMDLDEYIAYCRRVGAEPLVGVNLGSGRKYNRLQDSLDEARNLISYCRQKAYKVRHWYIGNECFKGWTAAQYAEYIDLYAEVLKAVDPDIVIIGDWQYGPQKDKRFEQALLIAKKSKHINVMEIHEKWGDEWGMNRDAGAATMKTATLENWQKEPGIYQGRLDAYTERFFAEMKASGKEVKLAFNEWGAVITGENGLFNLALVKADYLISLFRHPIYSACDWNLNMGPGTSKILATTNNGHTLKGFNPAALIFELCAPALGKQSIPVASSDPVVYGFGARDAATGQVQVYLLNKRSDVATVTLKINGPGAKSTRCAVASFVAPGVIKESQLTGEGGNSTVRVKLAPLSFNRVSMPGQ